MLTQVSDAIVARLKAIEGIRHAGEWAGQIEDLIKTSQVVPSVHVIYAGSQFEAAPLAIGTRIAPHRQAWSIVLLSKNLRSRADGALEAYSLIEQVRESLIKFAVPGGWLWPQREGLILARNGLLGYGLDYSVQARTAG